MNTLDYIDLIHTIRTVQLYATWFDEQTEKALKDIKVNKGKEVQGTILPENLDALEQSAYLISKYYPTLHDKITLAISHLKKDYRRPDYSKGTGWYV